MADVAEYTDPRLVAVYDTVCPFGPDTDFYLGLAAEAGTDTIVDVGCGTGALAVELAGRGHTVVGLDPSHQMLAVARRRPGGGRVRWIEGDASRLDVRDADLALMTSHVAQVIVDDDVFRMTLDATRQALRPGGRLAFESRDPRARAWAAGAVYDTRRQFEHPDGGHFEMWQEVAAVEAGVVDYELRYCFDDGEELVSRNQLRFRTEDELCTALVGAGFAVERCFGDWDRSPVGELTPELIYVAIRD
jgi:ubiquinone/menaquinone biosynthesis C-methylase UbiE